MAGKRIKILSTADASPIETQANDQQESKKEPKQKRQKKERSSLHHPCLKGQEFLLCTGLAVHTIKQLADELGRNDDAVYCYHTANGRNDFAQWIGDVFKAPALAEELRAAKNKDHACAMIYKHLIEH